MKLNDLVLTSKLVADTSGRLEKIALLAALLKRLAPNEVPIAIGFLTGWPRQGKWGVGWASVAEAHVWLGRIADRRDEHAEVDGEFEQAIRGFEKLGMRERLLQCHGVYAEILERRGELAKAYVHMKEALQASRPGLLRREQEEERVSSA